MNNKPVALVTGAGQGIGRGIAIELAKNGFDIIGNDCVFDPENKQKGLFEVKERIEGLDAVFFPVHGDILFPTGHDNIFEQSLSSFNEIDVLVNNAGIAPRERLDVLDTTMESFDRIMFVNTRGTFFLTQKIARQMIKQVENDEK